MTEAALREALEMVEWIEVPSGPGMVESECAWCQGTYPKHKKNCERQAALEAAEPVVSDEPVDLPFPTTDARKWAAEFVRLHGGDEGLMLSWFANAIEHGRGPDALEAAEPDDEPTSLPDDIPFSVPVERAQPVVPEPLSSSTPTPSLDAQAEVAYRLNATLAEAAAAGVTLDASNRRDLSAILVTLTPSLDVERLAQAIVSTRNDGQSATVVRHGDGSPIPIEDQKSLLLDMDRKWARRITAEYAKLESR